MPTTIAGGCDDSTTGSWIDKLIPASKKRALARQREVILPETGPIRAFEGGKDRQNALEIPRRPTTR